MKLFGTHVTLTHIHDHVPLSLSSGQISCLDQTHSCPLFAPEPCPNVPWIHRQWRLKAALKMKMFMGNSPPNAPCLFVLSTTSATFAQELTLAPTIGMWYAAGGSTDLHCGAACNAGAQVQSTKRSMTGRMRTRSHLHGMRHSRHGQVLLQRHLLVALLRPLADPRALSLQAPLLVL